MSLNVSSRPSGKFLEENLIRRPVFALSPAVLFHLKAGTRLRKSSPFKMLVLEDFGRRSFFKKYRNTHRVEPDRHCLNVILQNNFCLSQNLRFSIGSSFQPENFKFPGCRIQQVAFVHIVDNGLSCRRLQMFEALFL